MKPKSPITRREFLKFSEIIGAAVLLPDWLAEIPVPEEKVKEIVNLADGKMHQLNFSYSNGKKEFYIDSKKVDGIPFIKSTLENNNTVVIDTPNLIMLVPRDETFTFSCWIMIPKKGDL